MLSGTPLRSTIGDLRWATQRDAEIRKIQCQHPPRRWVLQSHKERPFGAGSKPTFWAWMQLSIIGHWEKTPLFKNYIPRVAQ